jgi:hypothetical protein
MFQITKNSIRMIRGDTGIVDLALQDGNGNAIAPTAYTAIFSLKKSIDDVQVEITQDGSIHTIGPNPFVILADVTRE